MPMSSLTCSVSGIGHKIKSVNNPDLRVELVKEYVLKNFPSHSLLDYALAVEKVTTAKKDTLILNVDGCIAVCFVDLLRDSGAFTREEADEYIRIGTLNGLFVLGRSIGFIGHHLGESLLGVWHVLTRRRPKAPARTAVSSPRRRHFHQYARRVSAARHCQDALIKLYFLDVYVYEMNLLLVIERIHA